MYLYFGYTYGILTILVQLIRRPSLLSALINFFGLQHTLILCNFIYLTFFITILIIYKQQFYKYPHNNLFQQNIIFSLKFIIFITTYLRVHPKYLNSLKKPLTLNSCVTYIQKYSRTLKNLIDYK